MNYKEMFDNFIGEIENIANSYNATFEIADYGVEGEHGYVKFDIGYREFNLRYWYNFNFNENDKNYGVNIRDYMGAWWRCNNMDAGFDYIKDSIRDFFDVQY